MINCEWVISTIKYKRKEVASICYNSLPSPLSLPLPHCQDQIIEFARTLFTSQNTSKSQYNLSKYERKYATPLYFQKGGVPSRCIIPALMQTRFYASYLIISISISLWPMKEEQKSPPSQEKPQPANTDHDSPRPQSKNQVILLEKQLKKKLCSSTYLYQNAHKDIHLRNVYVLNKNLLQSTRITPNIRARMRGFVMDQCSRQLITRDTCSLACTYIDLYLQRRGHVELQDFQMMAIACLMLARKQQEGKLPTISFNIFSKESLLQWQLRVVKRLQYQLLPPTYFNYAQHVAIKWELFPSRSSKFNKKFGHCEVGPNMILRLFYQQLECLFLVPQTLKWNLQLVVLNMFYLHAFSINVPHEFTPHLLSNQEFVKSYYAQDNEFKKIYQQFFDFYSKEKHFKLQPELGTYLKMFLGLKGSKKQFTVLNNNSKFNSLRVWDKLQTYSKQSYELAKAVMEKMKKK